MNAALRALQQRSKIPGPQEKIWMRAARAVARKKMNRRLAAQRTCCQRCRKAKYKDTGTKPRARCEECRYLNPLRMGDRVKMTPKFKAQLRKNGSGVHEREFGHCVGVIQGLVEYPKKRMGPDVNVRWLPSWLRYAYVPENLEIVG